MITLIASEEERRAASRVSQVAELVEVVLTKTTATNNLFMVKKSEVPVKLTFEVPSGDFEITTRNTLLVRSGIVVRGVVEAQDHDIDEDLNEEVIEDIGALIEVEFAAEFLIPEGPLPDEAEELWLPAFARLNGPYICMPYLRQAVQDLAGRMKLHVTLPALKIQGQAKEAAKPTKKTKKKPTIKKKTKKTGQSKR